MSFADDNADSILHRLDQDLRRPELVPGDLIYVLGRFEAIGWEFLGIPGTSLGVSYYFVTGDEDPVQYNRLAKLVT